MEVDPDGSLWVGTDKGLHRLTADQEWINYPSSNSLFILSIKSTSENGVWIGTHDGVLHISTDGTETRYLKGQDIISINVSDDGSVWCGGRGSLYKLPFDDTLKQFSEIDFPFEDDYVSAIEPTEDDGMYIGTYFNGLWSLSGAGRTVPLGESRSIACARPDDAAGQRPRRSR